MTPTTNERRALELLLRKIGNAGTLCRQLWISHGELEDYLSGARAIPPCVSLHALELLGSRLD